MKEISPDHMPIYIHFIPALLLFSLLLDILKVNLNFMVGILKNRANSNFIYHQKLKINLCLINLFSNLHNRISSVYHINPVFYQLCFINHFCLNYHLQSYNFCSYSHLNYCYFMIFFPEYNTHSLFFI